VFIAWATCGLTHVTVAALRSSCSLLCISNSDWATENEAGRSVSVNGNEEPRWRELSPIQFSCNCKYFLITHNKTPVPSTCGLLRVCAACQPPRLNLSSEFRPSGNNIQDTFPTGSTQDTTVCQLEIWQWIQTAVVYHFLITDCADRQVTTENSWLQIRHVLCTGYRSQVSACSLLYGRSFSFLEL